MGIVLVLSTFFLRRELNHKTNKSSIQKFLHSHSFQVLYATRFLFFVFAVDRKHAAIATI